MTNRRSPGLAGVTVPVASCPARVVSSSFDMNTSRGIAWDRAYTEPPTARVTRSWRRAGAHHRYLPSTEITTRRRLVPVQRLESGVEAPDIDGGCSGEGRHLGFCHRRGRRSADGSARHLEGRPEQPRLRPSRRKAVE